MKVYVVLSLNSEVREAEILAVETTRAGADGIASFYNFKVDEDREIEIHEQELTANGVCAERGGVTS